MNALPTKAGGIDIVGIVSEGDIKIVTQQASNQYHMSAVVCRVEFDGSLEYVAKQIVDLIKQARDEGFEQGRQFIRSSLGV